MALKEQILDVINGEDATEDREQAAKAIIAMGDKVFPIYDAILSDPKSNAHQVAGVFLLLSASEGSADRFVDIGMRLLSSDRHQARREITVFLKKHGSRQDASVLVALLSDADVTVSRAAAEALASIGGSREVYAMDVWLRRASLMSGIDVRHVRRCRDELAQRLKRQNPPPK